MQGTQTTMSRAKKKSSLTAGLTQFTVIILCLVSLNRTVFAETQLPGSTMPSVIRKVLTPRPTTNYTLPASTKTQPATQQNASTTLQENAKKTTFRLNKLIISGNHVYSDEQLLPFYKDKLHKLISVLDLFDIIQAITSFYRNNGYILSRALLPPQHVKDGVVQIQIIEGYIDKVSVTGKPLKAEALVKAFGEKIKQSRPLRVADMEKYIMLANAIPATTVSTALAPSEKTQGAADLNMVTDHHFFTGYFTYNNFGTLYIGPQQMTANVSANSFIQSGDDLSLTATKTPKGGELTFIDANYNAALWGATGDRLIVGGNYAHTHPLFILQPQYIDGSSNNYYINAQFPLLQEHTKVLTVTTNFNYLDSTVDQIGNQLLYTDHLRNVGINAAFNFSDKWNGTNLIFGELRQGLPMLGYSSNFNQNTALTSRPGGRGDYTKIDAEISRLQAIKGPYSIYGLIKGQWAFNPLLASEQFVYGGNQLGRGYDPAEIIGDKGAAASLELRYDKDVKNFTLQHIQLYAFYECGSMWNYLLVGGVPLTQSALSTGIGTRFYMNKWISGTLFWAQPLTKSVTALTETNEVLVNGQTINRGNGKAPRTF
ncbi:MAG: hypothetical protein A3F43_04575, partial [Gammaproteobacteria bacterium RIFCSPHIGHO2_12_FULL_42_10]